MPSVRPSYPDSDIFANQWSCETINQCAARTSCSVFFRVLGLVTPSFSSLDSSYGSLSQVPRATIVWKRASGLLYRRSHELTEYRTLMETTKSYSYFRFYTPTKKNLLVLDIVGIWPQFRRQCTWTHPSETMRNSENLSLSISSHYDDAGGLIMVVATTVGAQKTVLEQATNGPQHVRQQYAGRHGNTGEGRPRRRRGGVT